MSPEGLLTRSRPLRGNLSGVTRGARVLKQCCADRRRCQGTVPCEAKRALSFIPRQQHPRLSPPLGLALLCGAAALQSEGPRGSWGVFPVVKQGA